MAARTPTEIPSTPEDKKLMEKTWSEEFDVLLTLGSDIYNYIFKNMSACKRLFPWIIKYEDEGVDWKKTTEFKDQALKFVQVIDTVVWGIIDGDKSEPFLYDVGQRHVQYASRGFKASYWDVFLDAMQYAQDQRIPKMNNLNAQEKQRAKQIWHDVAAYIIKHMKSGFFDGQKGTNRYEEKEK
ncbi:glb-18 [Pristionchus pacificus]|nr:glb-18 [Pristionchus pacificus]